MAKDWKVKSARTAETLQTPGRHSAEKNLYLSISENGGRRWVFLYVFGVNDKGKPKRWELGLGSAAKGHVTLNEARDLAIKARKFLQAGTNPITDMGKAARDRQDKTIPTFGAFADEYIATHKSKFRNAKHIAQWEMTLKTYCQPIRALGINVIDTEAVLRVLQPIWSKVPETASRVRGRIENILDAAKAKGLRTGENPAVWRGHLKTLLPARQRLTRGHHAALPYDDLPAFMTALRARESTAALALELCILTAPRTSELLRARWNEFDLKKAIWTIPAERMKAGIEHRIPLSARALETLKSLPRSKHNDHIFPGNAKGKPLSSMAMSMLLRRMKQTEITVHGFRSTFSDWVSETQNSFSHETREHALAHQISDKAEASYRRGSQFEKRRKLMEAWASYCEPRKSAKIVQLKKGN